MDMEEFRQRQQELQRRVGRQRPRTLLRRKLERELQGLVAGAMRPGAITAAPDLPAPVSEWPEDEDHPLQWFQK